MSRRLTLYFYRVKCYKTKAMNPPHPVSPGIYRATLATVDLDAIAHNLHEIRSLLSHSTAVCAVVKADAYGHGAVPVARELEARGVDSFSVATVEEGLELREAGIRKPILVLGLGSSGVEQALDHELTPVVHNRESAKNVSEAARKAERPVPVHIKLDTGMGRLGLFPEGLDPILDVLRRDPRIRIQGIASHFSSAESDPLFTRAQRERFQEALGRTEGLLGTGIEQIHMANSAGILNCPEGAYTMVRPGIILYGVYPETGLASKIRLKPAMTFKTHVLDVKSHPAGSPVSYGQTFRTERPSRIATLPVGYADGYRRDLSNRGFVLVRGVRAPVAGTVTMDLTLVDVTDIPGVEQGDEVVLFGKTGQGSLPVEELAETINTIPYELLCAVSKRVPRLYCRSGETAAA